MKTWKRLLVLMLLLACICLLTSCGGGGEATGADGTAFVPVSIRYTAAPAEAFGENSSARVIAVSADREKLLITSPYDLYIWDVSAGKRIPVSFSAEEDLESLNLRVNNALAVGPNNKKLTEEQLEKMRDKGKKYLEKLNQTRFINVDQIMECYPQTIQVRAVCISMGEHFALISENANTLGMFSLDMRTGEARMIPSDQISGLYPVLCGDRLLTGIGITDLSTGEAVVTEYPEPREVPDEDYFSPRPVTRLLSDGSAVAIVQGALNSETREANYYLRKLSAAENSWDLLGSYPMGFSDSSLCITGDGKYAAVSPPYHLRLEPVIISLETGEKRMLDAEDLIIVGEYDTGFVCCSLKNLNIVRLDAGSLKQAKLRQTGGSWPEMNITVFMSLESNGRNYCAQNAVVRGYFTAETK